MLMHCSQGCISYVHVIVHYILYTIREYSTVVKVVMVTTFPLLKSVCSFKLQC